MIGASRRLSSSSLRKASMSIALWSSSIVTVEWFAFGGDGFFAVAGGRSFTRGG